MFIVQKPECLVHLPLLSGKSNLFFSKYFLTFGQHGNIQVFKAKIDHIEHVHCSNQCFCITVHIRYFKILKNNFFYLTISTI
jgi:hypothetical protein